MSRIALVVCLSVVFVGAGCNSSSDGHFATSEASTSPSNPLADTNSADSVDKDAAQAAPADSSSGDIAEPATTPVTTSARPHASGSNETLDISFDDIDLPMQEDMVFRPFMLTDRVRELDGRRVRLNGYMLPDSKTKGIKQFVLLKNTECKFGPGGQADHLVNVLMVEGSQAKFREDPVSVEGTLIVKPFTGPDGNTWSIYDLACENVQRYRPRR